MAPSTAYRGVLFASALWASSGLVGPFLHGALPPLALAAVRLCLGGLALSAMVGPTRIKKAWQRLPSRAVAQAVLGMGLFQWGFFASVDALGIGLSTLMPALVAPAAAQAIEGLCHGSQVRRLPGAAGVLSVASLLAGALLLASRFDGWAVVTALAAGVSYAFYASATASVQQESESESEGLAITAVALLGAGAVLLPLAAPHLQAMATVRGLAGASYLALPATAWGYAFFAAGLRHMPPSRALGLVLIPPVIAFLFEAMQADAALSASMLWGIVLIAMPALARHAGGFAARIPRSA